MKRARVGRSFYCRGQSRCPSRLGPARSGATPAGRLLGADMLPTHRRARMWVPASPGATARGAARACHARLLSQAVWGARAPRFDGAASWAPRCHSDRNGARCSRRWLPLQPPGTKSLEPGRAGAGAQCALRAHSARTPHLDHPGFGRAATVTSRPTIRGGSTAPAPAPHQCSCSHTAPSSQSGPTWARSGWSKYATRCMRSTLLAAI
jgi:hypothetical protein